MTGGPVSDGEISIPLKDVTLEGELVLPKGAVGLVIFAHGSGSSRHSPRNQYVAQFLRAAGLGTMLFDLLTGKEEQAEAYTRHLRFDIPFLANRLVAATRWVIERQAMNQRPIGYFGSSTGAGAALLAAAEPDNAIIAIVSRGGRPDLAGEALGRVKAPTLLIVGGNDETVITLNQEAREQLHAESDLKIVPAASHLFEEPGTLDLVAQMASDWFVRHFKKPRPF